MRALFNEMITTPLITFLFCFYYIKLLKNGHPLFNMGELLVFLTVKCVGKTAVAQEAEVGA